MKTGTFPLTALDGNKVTRDYEIMVPTGYNPKIPLKLTFVYHGANAKEADAVKFGIQNAPGALAEGIFLFPQGIAYKSYGVGWDDSCSGYDMPLFDNMLSYIENNYCIDESKVFAAGFSWGGDHVTALACCRGDRIRAVAPASCTDEFNNVNSVSPPGYMTYQNLTCPVKTKAAIRFTHNAGTDGPYSVLQLTSTSELYRYFNGCTDGQAQPAAGTCETYSGCAEPVVECVYPASYTSHNPISTWGSDTWSFFSGF